MAKKNTELLREEQLKKIEGHLSEVRRLGFSKCLIPKRIQGKLAAPEGLELIRVANIREALAALL